MKITCMGCQNYEFEIKISDFELEETLQVSLECPNCNKRTLIEPLYKGGRSISLHKTCFDAIYYDLSYSVLTF